MVGRIAVGREVKVMAGAHVGSIGYVRHVPQGTGTCTVQLCNERQLRMRAYRIAYQRWSVWAPVGGMDVVVEISVLKKVAGEKVRR